MWTRRCGNCFPAQYVDTQHLAREGLVNDAFNDLMPINPGLAIVDLPIIAIGDPDLTGSDSASSSAWALKSQFPIVTNPECRPHHQP
jgi:hypothetical protein